MKTTKMTTTNSLTTTTSSAWVCCLLELFSNKLLQLELHRAFGASNAGEIVVKKFLFAWHGK
jgi:hypothetical protein